MKTPKKQTFITDYFSSKRKKKKYITDYFKKKSKPNKKNDIIYGYNSETESWHCTSCGLDMGKMNPRQLCGKYFCYYYQK